MVVIVLMPYHLGGVILVEKVEDFTALWLLSIGFEPSASAKCHITCRDLRIFDLPVPCQCLAISLVSPDKASKARFLLQVFCKPLKFFIFCKAVLVLDMDNSVLLPALCHTCYLHHTPAAPRCCCPHRTTLLLPAPHHSCCLSCCCLRRTTPAFN